MAKILIRMVNFSIIIPHKNIPALLERCLASIPERDDVQIIVVDDSSDAQIVDFQHFPGLNRKGVEVIFHKSHIGGAGGPGFARNRGIEIARGKWLIFADADDFFHTLALNEAMDKYASEESLDMVFFRHDSIDNQTLEPVAINTERNRILADFGVGARSGLGFGLGDFEDLAGAEGRGFRGSSGSGSWGAQGSASHGSRGSSGASGSQAEELARFRIWVPWGRFIRREMIENQAIRFDEVRFSNYVLFSVRAGHFARQIAVDQAITYCNVRRAGSLIHEGRRDWAAMEQRFDVDFRAAIFALGIGKVALFQRVIIDRWRELSRIDRRRARKLIPQLRQICTPGQLRRMLLQEMLALFFNFLKSKR